jgi:hypothetical protein
MVYVDNDGNIISVKPDDENFENEAQSSKI